MMICMRKLIENFLFLGAFFLTGQSVLGFVNEGPIANGDDTWQIPLIGYGGLNPDPVAPKDIYEEYRLVVPVLYYAGDASFLNYYGAGGQTNIDAAFAIVNGVTCGQTNTPLYLYSPTNGVYVDSSGNSSGTTVSLNGTSTLDRYSADMSEFPLISQQINYTAETLDILDVKSLALHLMLGEMGLGNPDRYVWTLHDRLTTVNNPKCPQDEQYFVVQRNFDVNPFLNNPYSSYINDTLYTFYIAENCGQPPGAYPYDARTFPAPADTAFGTAYSAVAAGGLDTFEFGAGGYYTGLTRDDAAGLRYLLSSNNINYEATAPSGSQLFTISTNPLAPQVFPPNGALAATITAAGYYYYDGTYGYGDLAALYAFARTNTQATLQATYPGLIVSGVGISWALATNQTYSSYYAPAPVDSPYGSPPQFVVVTNYTPYYQFFYNYTFANLFTNHYSARSKAVRQTVSASAPIGSPYGTTSITNSVTLNLTNQASGDFFVLPPFYNNVCPMDIVSYPGIASVFATTNLLTSANTNVVAVGTNFSSSVYLITYFTNYQYVIYPVTCTQGTAPPALRRGIGRVGFIRANYDSLLGQFFSPLTNDYSMVMITNGQQVTEHYQRVVTKPDFLFQAADLTISTQNQPYGVDSQVTTPVFDQSTILNGLAGPGTIIPGATITFNKNEGGALYLNGSLNNYNISTNSFLNPYYQVPFEAWGSFDGSTNDPVIYPNSLSLANLGNQMLFLVTPTSVPDGTVGVAYNGGAGVTFTAAGGQPPFVWALSPPVPGLNFDATTATLSGTPVASGVFSFTLQVTDAGNRTVNLNYLITIH